MTLFKKWQAKYIQPPANSNIANVANTGVNTPPTLAVLATLPLATIKTENNKSSSSPINEAQINEWRRKGLSDAEAEKMAEVLAERERLLDDRRACIECQHSYMKRCKAGLSPIGWSDTYTLHRCKGFEP